MCFIFSLILFLGTACSGETAYLSTDVVQLDSGPIVGFVQDSVNTYLGIPYAAPPIGNLRWKPPAAVTSWTETRIFREFGNACPQPDSGVEYGEISESCLYLNVWAPANSSQLPVMVWIHGGAFLAGSGSYSLYDGKKLAKKGVIVVTINYRLGPLGFLAHSSLSAESERSISGNYGLLDQIAALQWVRTNISAFGGDPDNVTIFGESAGSVSAVTLMISPPAEGLFQRVIAESGTPLLNNYYFPSSNGSLSSAEQIGAEFASALGCSDNNEVLLCMRGKTYDDIIETAGVDSSSYYISQYPFFPTIDGWVIPDTPKILFDEGNINDVPIIIGTNANEGKIFISVATGVDQYESWVNLVFGDNAETVLENFPATEDNFIDVFGRVYTLALFTQPARFVAKAMENMVSKAYLYQLTRVPSTAEAEAFGAYHGLDISYVFRNMSAADGYDATDFALSDNIMDYWVNFATSGDPNGNGLAAWPEYDSTGDQNLQFGNSISVNTALDKSECDLFNSLLGTW